MTQPTTTDLVGTLGADDELPDLAHLARALGGDATSGFTGQLLQLVGKADPGNRDRLRLAYPRAVAAYELWELYAPGLTAGALQQWLDLDPLVTVLTNSGEELLKLTALKSALAQSGVHTTAECTAGALPDETMTCGRPRPCPNHD